jgi:hypothetical protein
MVLCCMPSDWLPSPVIQSFEVCHVCTVPVQTRADGDAYKTRTEVSPLQYLYKM